MFPVDIGGGARLRLCGAADAPDLFTLIDRNRESIGRWLPWVDLTRSVADVVEFLERARAQHEAGDGFHAGIFDGDAIAGFIGMHPIDWPNRRVELGYWLDANARGRGLVTRAAGAVTRLCFDHYGLNRVEIRCGVENHASCAVAERLGFVLEGTLREAQWVGGRAIDLRVYARLAADGDGSRRA